ncbi:MAG: SusC/RagA family TonB-linked outer membrane protein [Bacteroidota bacterium]
MYKKLQLVLLCSILLSVSAFAQTGTITGTITDKNGEVLPTVNVRLDEITKGAATDADGIYTITNVPTGNYTLIASFTGYKEYKATVQIGSGTTTLDIEMEEDILGIGEVVVTALGFEENRDQSGISSSNVTGATLTTTGEASVLNGLAAKAPGVNIIQSSGDPGSSARILIRGQNSLTGNNQPLFVIDGFPVSNNTIGQGTDGTSQQSRINDLNLDDVQSVEVLKGPSAASLWGSRAANGVIVIKTKSGSSSRRNIGISVKSSLSVDDLVQTVNLQDSFGQGADGQYVFNSLSSWGDRIASRSGRADVVDANGVITQKNSTQVFDHSQSGYERGYIWDNAISISGGNPVSESSYYLNVSNLNNSSILQGNSDYERTSLRLNASKKFLDNLRVNATANYIRTISDRAQTGSNISGINLGLWRTPADFNLNPFQVDFTDPNSGAILTDRHRSYRNGNGASNNPRYNNPLWTLNIAQNGTSLDRVIGGTEIVYNPTSWLDITHRLGLDRYSERRFFLLPVFDATTPGGSLSEQSLGEYQINSDLILRAIRQVGQNILATGTLGYNLNHREFDIIESFAQDFILPNQPRNIASAFTITPSQFRSTQRTSALYGSLDMNLYSQVFVTVTGRSESASTYGELADQTVFYPSASVAWQFTGLDALQDSPILSFGKLRAEFGQAGVQPGVYVTTTPFNDRTHASSWGPTLNPIAYGGGYARADQRGNPEIKNELVTEFAFGTDLRFFRDRLSLGLTRYFTRTEDAILQVTLPSSSGFNTRFVNAGEMENNGWEVDADFAVINNRNFRWITTAIWFKNINRVTRLAGTNEVFLNGFTGSSSSLVEGEPHGVIYGDRFERDGNGVLILDGNGFPQISPTEGVLGDPNPDWRASIGNRFNYRNLSLNVLFDIKHGGDVWNGTRGALAFFGRNADQDWWTTLSGDQLNLTNFKGETPADVIADGRNTYINNGDGTVSFRGYIDNFGGGDVLVDEYAFSEGPLSGFTGPTEQFVEDGGFVRLREITVGYSLRSSRFRAFSGLSSVDFNVTGRNLLLITNYSGIDPETNLTGPSNGQGLDYFQVPNTRSFIFTVRVNY